MKISKTTAVLFFIWLCLIIRMCHVLYNTWKAHNLAQIHIDPDESEDQKEYLESDREIMNKVREMHRSKDKIRFIKGLIKNVNDKQHIGSVDESKASTFKKVAAEIKKSNIFKGIKLNNTVLVIQVNDDSKDVYLLLESIRRVVGISGSLLIFAHGYYDPQIYSVINKIRFARVMQVFYPYSTQLHPYAYPGEDIRFCPEWSGCIYSNERDPFLVQTKLFWWWVINEVFDHIEILKHYDGHIYFLEAEHYLTNDFILMAKRLERFQPLQCSECQIISLGSHTPRAESYRRVNSSVIVGVWGWSNYTNSGIGFNRTTWNEIKSLKEEFCYFNDSTWEFSLRHLASKTPRKRFYMLSPEGPRIFLTNNCRVFGNRTHCDLKSIRLNIGKFMNTISDGLFPYKFKLVFDDLNDVTETPEEDLWGWEDARDREMCMFLASKGRRIYY